MSEPSAHPFVHPRYTRSNAYDPAWVSANQMGPNVLWLAESLCEVLPIEPGARVLDLGCGKAMSSVFLAREFGARVWATDLWIDATDNRRRIDEAGVGDTVVPVHAEAHALPFAHGFFDAIVSLDAYQYFGTDDLYLGYLVQFLKPGGRLGIVVPAGLYEIGADVPEQLQAYWEWDFCCFHGPQWWRTHWHKTGKVTVDHADAIEDGWQDWLRFNDATADALEGWRREAANATHHMLSVDRGQYFGFSRLVATRPV